MRLVSTSGRVALAGLLAIFLSACSSTSDQEIAETFAEQRANMLSKIVPVHMKGYDLVRIKAKGSDIELTLLFSGNKDVAPVVLAESILKTYCSDTEILSLMEKGVNYILVFRDMRGRPIFERPINLQNCEK